MNEQNYQTYEIVGVNSEGQTTVRGQTIEYLSLALSEKGKNVFKSSNTDPFVNIFGSNAGDQRKIDAVKACKDQNGKYDTQKLKELGDVEGRFLTLTVPPYYVKDRSGDYMTYPDGHPDAGKPIISNRISVFIWRGEEASLDEIKIQNMSNRELVNTAEMDPNRYANAAAQMILKKAKADDTGNSGQDDEELDQPAQQPQGQPAQQQQTKQQPQGQQI